MSDWLEHVREKYERICYYRFYQGMRGVGIGVAVASALMFADNFVVTKLYFANAPEFNGNAPDLVGPLLGILAGGFIYGISCLLGDEGPFAADMRQVELERKKAELDKRKTADISSLEKQILAIENSRSATENSRAASS